MAFPNKQGREKISSREPAHRRLMQSPALVRIWGDGDLVTISPDDPITNGVLDGAIAQASESVRPLQERKDAALAQRREARTPAAKAAQSLLAEEQGEAETPESDAEAERIKAAAEAFVAQMTPAELAAVEQASIQRAAKEAQVELAREAADQAAEDEFRAQHVDALGFDPEAFSGEDEEFIWQDECEPEAGEAA